MVPPTTGTCGCAWYLPHKLRILFRARDNSTAQKKLGHITVAAGPCIWARSAELSPSQPAAAARSPDEDPRRLYRPSRRRRSVICVSVNRRSHRLRCPAVLRVAAACRNMPHDRRCTETAWSYLHDVRSEKWLVIKMILFCSNICPSLA